MSDIAEARRALVSRILEADGKATRSLRMAAFSNSGLAEPLDVLVDKVATDASAVTDDDINAAKRSGRSEDQLFEMMVCAAIGQATRQYDSAIEALETAVKS